MNKEKFNKLVEEKYYEFQNLKEKINPNNLIYNYKLKEKFRQILVIIKVR